MLIRSSGASSILSQMPVQLGRKGAAGEGMEQEIAPVSQVLDPPGQINLGRQMVEQASIGDKVTLEALVGVADEIGIIDRSIEAARIAHCAGQRDAVAWPPGGDQG